MITLLSVRVMSLALLVPMLFEPVLRFVDQPAAPQRPLIFLVDTSGSMSVPDVPNGPSRIQSVWQTIAPLLPKIRGHFVPRFYSFSTNAKELKRAEDLANISADGKATDFVTAVNKAAADSATQKDAGIILISDGNDNVSPGLVDLLRQTGRKIDTVTVGSELAEPANFINVAVDSVAAPRDASVGHEAKLTATIKNTALANHVVDVNLAEIDESGKPTGTVTTRRLVLQASTDGQKVDLPYTPRVAGVRKLAVWIDPIPGERTLADNRQEIQLLAIESRLRLLYIEGALRPEYTYLNRMLGHDADIELATLLRLQRDRFAAAGTVDNQPFTAMPAAADDWKQFDVILIGDLDASFLDAPEQAMILQRVNDGAGLLMIGGQKNFGAGGYKGSAIEEALPVFVGDISAPQDKDEFVPQLTAEGAANPIMDQLTDFFPPPGPTTRPAAKILAPLKGNVVVAGEKSGAQILLTHPGKTGPDGKEEIVLAVQQYGRGRSAAFTADTTNVWYRQFRDQGQDSAYNRFWGQLIRWLAGQDARNRQKGAGLEALLDKSTYLFGESAKVRAIVRDEHGDTTQFASVTATLKGDQLAKPIDAPLTIAADRAGEYELILPPTGEPGLKPGDYTVDVSASKDGKPLGSQTLKFTVIPPDDEMTKIAANPQLMEQIAAETGGFQRPLAELGELLDTLIATDPAAKTDAMQRTVPLANTVRALMVWAGRDVPWPANSDLPMEGALVIGLLTGEWILRRKWQLA
jgi:uncharacterized membrane protein/methylmalonyl-CoA mutase cobalamin-binding subunit